MLLQNILRFIVFLVDNRYIRGYNAYEVKEMNDYPNVILDLLERVKKLESEVDKLKDELDKIQEKPSTKDDGERDHFVRHVPCSIEPFVDNAPTAKRDTTRYMFNGSVLLKNRLVLAVVKDYVAKKPDITVGGLKSVFDKSLQGSIGVVEDVKIAVLRKDYRIRFFAEDDETLKLKDGQAFVCSQWGILNIPNFIARARELGYEITPVR